MQDLNWLDNKLEKLESISCIISLPPHKIVFAESSTADYIYYIHEGYIKCYYNTADGKEIIISINKKNELIDLPAILLNKKHNAFAKTISHCVVWKIAGEDFKQLLLQDAEMAYNVTRLLCLYINKSYSRLETLLASDTESRLAKLLYYLADDKDYKQKTYRLNYHLTHQELGDMIGACRQTITNILGKFRNKGYIKINKHSGIEIKCQDE
ncbi:Crp/Fnr family transcriptional regulator [Pectinatus cerevisiiphilus]|uniref:CRP-like cAMP-binding protein n=1 Tax=Pectinatus cerevisiiphilus TaxID=86956 RepID=A0A4R3K414_9FIRM|nr:Crp/Fnr family transcriptional regulator [Pectinatus cerevisiiphilus]TCS77494.1 CRP-like cAMP-binding protein [Pectinatus cerevisiiphilus]